MITTTAVILASYLALANAVLTPSNLIAPSSSGALSAISYTSVGGTGTYNQVTSLIPGTFPTCSANPSCVTTPKSVSGPLAPFNEDLTMVFRGPMVLYNVAVYQPQNVSAATWKRVSNWAAGAQPENMVFMNNMGGGASGEWSICGGSSQSYANGDFTSTVATANQEVHSGNLPANKEVNIMTSTPCSQGGCNGFSRGTANLGWAESKMFVFTFQMPGDSSALPAIWALNGQVVRAAQYGCNCRGMGGNGGCGEIDIAETLVANSPKAISEIYSFKGATGSGDGAWFARPDGGKATLAAVFDVKTDTITIARLTDFDYSQTQLSRSLVDGYLAAPGKVVPFGSSNQRRSRAFGLHRRHH